MNADAEKDDLLGYLRVRRANLLGKLDGLSEYDIRRPITPTGTNLLGLVKHVATVQLDYFGLVFGRPSRSLPWLAGDAALCIVKNGCEKAAAEYNGKMF